MTQRLVQVSNHGPCCCKAQKLCCSGKVMWLLFSSWPPVVLPNALCEFCSSWEFWKNNGNLFDWPYDKAMEMWLMQGFARVYWCGELWKISSTTVKLEKWMTYRFERSIDGKGGQKKFPVVVKLEAAMQKELDLILHLVIGFKMFRGRRWNRWYALGRQKPIGMKRSTDRRTLLVLCWSTLERKHAQ